MAKILDFTTAKVLAISSGTVLLFLYKNGESVQMSRSFMQMHEGLQDIAVGTLGKWPLTIAFIGMSVKLLMLIKSVLERMSTLSSRLRSSTK